MPVDQSLVGRELPADRPSPVTEEAVRAFVAATGGRYAGGPAPATFPIVLAFDAMNALPRGRVASTCSAIVHGEQKFAYERPSSPATSCPRR